MVWEKIDYMGIQVASKTEKEISREQTQKDFLSKSIKDNDTWIRANLWMNSKLSNLIWKCCLVFDWLEVYNWHVNFSLLVFLRNNQESRYYMKQGLFKSKTRLRNQTSEENCQH